MKAFREVLIFSTVWPEPMSSAAGVRQLQWVDYFRSRGAKVTLSSPSKMKADHDWGALQLPDGVRVLPLPLNDSSVLETLKELKPDLVMFDRFILEEQFGHFVYALSPVPVVVLETQDLHFVRRARDALKENLLEGSALPIDFYQTETALRETASIERVDFTFLVSSFEEALLKEQFQIGPERAAWVPFFYQDPWVAHSAVSSDEGALVWIGNFRHPPNVDGLRWFRKEIWPKIRAQLPKAQVRIYGAYASEEVMGWHKPKEGFSVLGSAPDLETVFKHARVNLAPLRFGAGIKGKILEGFRYGIPCVTTSVGAEGILNQDSSPSEFPGLVADTADAFADSCVKLFQEPDSWLQLRAQAEQIMKNDFAFESVAERIDSLLTKIDSVRWLSRILRQESVNSRLYFSRWIEEKEKKRDI